MLRNGPWGKLRHLAFPLLVAAAFIATVVGLEKCNVNSCAIKDSSFRRSKNVVNAFQKDRLYTYSFNANQTMSIGWNKNSSYEDSQSLRITGTYTLHRTDDCSLHFRIADAKLIAKNGEDVLLDVNPLQFVIQQGDNDSQPIICLPRDETWKNNFKRSLASSFLPLNGNYDGQKVSLHVGTIFDKPGMQDFLQVQKQWSDGNVVDIKVSLPKTSQQKSYFKPQDLLGLFNESFEHSDFTSSDLLSSTINTLKKTGDLYSVESTFLRFTNQEETGDRREVTEIDTTHETMHVGPGRNEMAVTVHLSTHHKLQSINPLADRTSEDQSVSSTTVTLYKSQWELEQDIPPPSSDPSIRHDFLDAVSKLCSSAFPSATSNSRTLKDLAEVGRAIRHLARMASVELLREAMANLKETSQRTACGNHYLQIISTVSPSTDDMVEFLMDLWRQNLLDNGIKKTFLSSIGKRYQNQKWAGWRSMVALTTLLNVTERDLKTKQQLLWTVIAFCNNVLVVPDDPNYRNAVERFVQDLKTFSEDLDYGIMLAVWKTIDLLVPLLELGRGLCAETARNDYEKLQCLNLCESRYVDYFQQLLSSRDDDLGIILYLNLRQCENYGSLWKPFLFKHLQDMRTSGNEGLRTFVHHHLVGIGEVSPFSPKPLNNTTVEDQLFSHKTYFRLLHSFPKSEYSPENKKSLDLGMEMNLVMANDVLPRYATLKLKLLNEVYESAPPIEMDILRSPSEEDDGCQIFVRVKRDGSLVKSFTWNLNRRAILNLYDAFVARRNGRGLLEKKNSEGFVNVFLKRMKNFLQLSELHTITQLSYEESRVSLPTMSGIPITMTAMSERLLTLNYEWNVSWTGKEFVTLLHVHPSVIMVNSDTATLGMDNKDIVGYELSGSHKMSANFHFNFTTTDDQRKFLTTLTFSQTNQPSLPFLYEEKETQRLSRLSTTKNSSHLWTLNETVQIERTREVRWPILSSFGSCVEKNQQSKDGTPSYSVITRYCSLPNIHFVFGTKSGKGDKIALDIELYLHHPDSSDVEVGKWKNGYLFQLMLIRKRKNYNALPLVLTLATPFNRMHTTVVRTKSSTEEALQVTTLINEKEYSARIYVRQKALSGQKRLPTKCGQLVKKWSDIEVESIDVNRDHSSLPWSHKDFHFGIIHSGFGESLPKMEGHATFVANELLHFFANVSSDKKKLNSDVEACLFTSMEVPQTSLNVPWVKHTNAEENSVDNVFEDYKVGPFTVFLLDLMNSKYGGVSVSGGNWNTYNSTLVDAEPITPPVSELFWAEVDHTSHKFSSSNRVRLLDAKYANLHNIPGKSEPEMDQPFSGSGITGDITASVSTPLKYLGFHYESNNRVNWSFGENSCDWSDAALPKGCFIYSNRGTHRFYIQGLDEVPLEANYARELMTSASDDTSSTTSLNASLGKIVNVTYLLQLPSEEEERLNQSLASLRLQASADVGSSSADIFLNLTRGRGDSGLTTAVGLTVKQNEGTEYCFRSDLSFENDLGLIKTNTTLQNRPGPVFIINATIEKKASGFLFESTVLEETWTEPLRATLEWSNGTFTLDVMDSNGTYFDAASRLLSNEIEIWSKVRDHSVLTLNVGDGQIKGDLDLLQRDVRLKLLVQMGDSNAIPRDRKMFNVLVTSTSIDNPTLRHFILDSKSDLNVLPISPTVKLLFPTCLLLTNNYKFLSRTKLRIGNINQRLSLATQLYPEESNAERTMFVEWVLPTADKFLLELKHQALVDSLNVVVGQWIKLEKVGYEPFESVTALRRTQRIGSPLLQNDEWELEHTLKHHEFFHSAFDTKVNFIGNFKSTQKVLQSDSIQSLKELKVKLEAEGKQKLSPRTIQLTDSILNSSSHTVRNVTIKSSCPSFTHQAWAIVETKSDGVSDITPSFSENCLSYAVTTTPKAQDSEDIVHFEGDHKFRCNYQHWRDFQVSLRHHVRLPQFSRNFIPPTLPTNLSWEDAVYISVKSSADGKKLPEGSAYLQSSKLFNITYDRPQQQDGMENGTMTLKVFPEPFATSLHLSTGLRNCRLQTLSFDLDSSLVSKGVNLLFSQSHSNTQDDDTNVTSLYSSLLNLNISGGVEAFWILHCDSQYMRRITSSEESRSIKLTHNILCHNLRKRLEAPLESKSIRIAVNSSLIKDVENVPLLVHHSMDVRASAEQPFQKDLMLLAVAMFASAPSVVSPQIVGLHVNLNKGLSYAGVLPVPLKYSLNVMGKLKGDNNVTCNGLNSTSESECGVGATGDIDLQNVTSILHKLYCQRCGTTQNQDDSVSHYFDDHERIGSFFLHQVPVSLGLPQTPETISQIDGRWGWDKCEAIYTGFKDASNPSSLSVSNRNCSKLIKHLRNLDKECTKLRPEADMTCLKSLSKRIWNFTMSHYNPSVALIGGQTAAAVLYLL